MNVHQGVALHADIERLHVIAAAGHHIADLCHDKAGSKRGRVELQKSMQLFSDTASLLAQDMRTHVNVVKGSGGTSYVAKRLATEARYSLDSRNKLFLILFNKFVTYMTSKCRIHHLAPRQTLLSAPALPPAEDTPHQARLL